MSKSKSNGPNEPLLPSEGIDKRKPGKQYESPGNLFNTSDEVVIKEERLKTLDDVYEGFGTFHPYFIDRLLVAAFIYFVLHLPISYMDFIVDFGFGTSGCFETMNQTMYTFWWYCRCSDSSLTNTSDTMKSDALVIYIDKSSHRNPYDDAPYICFIFVSIFAFLFSGRSRRMSLLWLLSFLSFFSTLIVAMSWCEWSGSADSKCEGKESRYLTGPFMAILIAFCRLGGGLIMCQLIELAPLRLRPIAIASYIMAGSLSTVAIGVSIYVIYLKEMSVAVIVWVFAVLSITPIPLSFLYVQDTPYFYLAKARIDSLQRCFEQILKRKAYASKIRPDKLVDDLAFETREVVDSVIDRVGVVARAWRLPLKIFVLLVIGCAGESMKQYFTGEYSILRQFFITRMDVFLIESVIDVLGALVGVALVRQARVAINCVFPHRLAFQYAIPFVVVSLPLAIANIFPPVTYFCVATGEYCYHDFLFIVIVTLSLLGGIFAAALSLVVILQLLEFFPTDCRLFGYLTYRPLLNIICRMFVPEFIASIQNWPNVHGSVAFAHLILFAVAALAQMANDVNRRMHCYYADIAGMNKVRKSARIPAAPVLADEEMPGTNVTN